jgi:hypothetical protein
VFGMSRKELIDRFQSKFISRKLLVFIVACFGLFLGVLTSGDFVVIASSYMIAQGGKDILIEYFKSKNGVM